MYKLIKRIFDFMMALIAIIVLLPFMIPIMIGLLLTGEHYIFYFQKRMGMHGKTFDMWKFATMLKNSPNMLTGTTTLRDDPRVLPMGKFLRKTKINELPQLVNILKGDMSFVGPRPTVPKHYSLFSLEGQKLLSQLKPGLSGIGSIIFRDEEYYISQTSEPELFFKDEIQPRKEELEKWYFNKRSLYVDFMIIIITVIVVIKPTSNIAYKVFPDLPAFDLQAAVNQFTIDN